MSAKSNQQSVSSKVHFPVKITLSINEPLSAKLGLMNVHVRTAQANLGRRLTLLFLLYENQVKAESVVTDQNVRNVVVIIVHDI